MSRDIYLKCSKIAGKLRVRIISDGYNKLANCQFPRDIRIDGSIYCIKERDITLANGPRGKFFYRIAKHNIRVIPEEPDFVPEPILPDQVYRSDCCCICLTDEPNKVIVPCGHLCLCSGCSTRLGENRCPLCRGDIQQMIDPSLME